MNKYLSGIHISVQQQFANRGLFVGRIFLYLSVVYLFYQVFHAVSATPERIWYLAITEWLILSTAPLAFQICDDIKSGQIAYFMLRPLGYLSYRFCDGLGSILVRFVVLEACCLGLGYGLTGMIPGSLLTWLLGSLVGFLAVILYTVLGMLIGLLSFWIREIQTVVYLNLTATFCFGGLIVPLEFYSETLRFFCFSTPYPWILWWPAQLLTGAKINFFATFLGWGTWMVILCLIIHFLYQKCLQAFVAEGG